MHKHCARPRGLFLKLMGIKKDLSQLAEEPSLVLGLPQSGREVRAWRTPGASVWQTFLGMFGGA